MKAIMTIILLLSICSISAQSDVIYAKINNKQIELTVPVEAGMTLYSISKTFATSVNDILARNNRKNNDLSVGEHLKVVSSKINIITSFRTISAPRAINYRVQKGDNLYRISKAFGVSEEEIIALNGKPDQSLRHNEVLLVGWVDLGTPKPDETDWTAIDDIEPIFPQRSEINVATLESDRLDISLITSDQVSPAPTLNQEVQETIEKEHAIKKEKGIAFWEKSRYDNTDLIVMHPTAKVNSKISLYNPMLKRKVEAKVVGEMPEESYAEDVSVVISPSVADALGALDRRFLVEITYVE